MIPYLYINVPYLPYFRKLLRGNWRYYYFQELIKIIVMNISGFKAGNLV